MSRIKIEIEFDGTIDELRKAVRDYEIDMEGEENAINVEFVTPSDILTLHYIGAMNDFNGTVISEIIE